MTKEVKYELTFNPMETQLTKETNEQIAQQQKLVEQLTGHRIHIYVTNEYIDICTQVYKAQEKENGVLSYQYHAKTKRIGLHDQENSFEDQETIEDLDVTKIVQYLLCKLVHYIFKNYKSLDFMELMKNPLYDPQLRRGETPTWYKEAPKNAN